MGNEGMLRLKVDGQPGDIDLKALEKSIAAVSKILRAVGGPDSFQYVKELRTGSAVIDIITPAEDVTVVSKGLQALKTGTHLPGQFNRMALKAVWELHEVTKLHGVTNISFGHPEMPVCVDSTVAGNSEILLSNVFHSLGSVVGTLYKFNGKDGKPRAGMTNSRTGKEVRLELEEKHVPVVLQLMCTEVTVRGLLERDALTNEVLSVKVKEVTAVAPRRIQPPARTMQGILGSEWLGDIDPAELVRRERGA